MKKNFILFLVRLARFFRKEDWITPQLNAVPENRVRTNRLYAHYGRIMLSRPNPEKVREHYYIGDNEVNKRVYEDKLQEYNGIPITINMRHEYTGQACHLCACEQYGLPCRCDFTTGPFSGYYELIHTAKQYSTTPIKPAKQPLVL